MGRLWKFLGVGAACAVALAAAGLGGLWLFSESVIERHYPLLTVDVPLSGKPDDIARGRHLARLTGCTDCHGERLQGRLLAPGNGLRIYAPNLTRAAATLTPEEFARAFRDGLTPDGHSLWAMPSETWTYMSTADAAAIVDYVRALRPQGAQTPPVRFALRDRWAIATGEFEPTAERVAEVQDDGDPSDASLDLGPRYEGGRTIARLACAQCHGLDLAGTPDGRVPDLQAVSRYSLRDFFGLMREGHAPDRRESPAMHRLARGRFAEFRDYEIMALYDYLRARAAALPPRG
ncbi:MAG TPA: c-type cytochrome [Rhizomicrobium sp.]|nr:c-type cytochrome [Rhizomicrobium sp.]